MKSKKKLKDIIDMEHPTSTHHPRMPRKNRAVQFAPFSALDGYEESIFEVGRVVHEKIELDETQKLYINEILCEIQNIVQLHPLISITYFQKDKTKKGGMYQSIEERVKKINIYESFLLLENKERIAFNDIYSIDIKKE